MELDDVDPLAVGALSPAEGALPATLWRGSDVVLVQRAIDAAAGLDAPGGVAALTARVLRSGGQGPSGDDDRVGLAVARVQALAALGHADAVAELVSATPALRNDTAAAELGVRAHLAMDALAPACALADDVSRTLDTAGSGFWTRARIACFVFAGEATAAEVTMDAARAAGVDGIDTTFAEWVISAAGSAGAAPSKTPRNSLELALARAANAALTDDTLGALDPIDLAALAGDDGADHDVRLHAARKLLRSGALDAASYAALVRDAAAAPEQSSAELLDAAHAAKGAARDVLYHQAVSAADTPIAKAAAIAAALNAAETPDAFRAAASLYANELVFLQVNPDTLIHAPAFIAAAAASGDTRLARTWLRARLFAVGAASTPPTPSDLVTPTSAPVALGAQDDPFAVSPASNPSPATSGAMGRAGMEPLAPGVEAALRALVTTADPSSSERALGEAALGWLASAPNSVDAERAAAVLLALGARSTPELRRAAARAQEAGAVSSPARTHAAAARRAADASSEASSDEVDMDAASDALSSLVRAGLADDARRIAADVMVLGWRRDA